MSSAARARTQPCRRPSAAAAYGMARYSCRVLLGDEHGPWPRPTAHGWALRGARRGDDLRPGRVVAAHPVRDGQVERAAARSGRRPAAAGCSRPPSGLSSHSAISDGRMRLDRPLAERRADVVAVYRLVPLARARARPSAAAGALTATAPNFSRPAFGSTYSPRSASASIFAAYFLAASCSGERLGLLRCRPGRSRWQASRFATLLPPRSGCRAVLRRFLSNQRSRHSGHRTPPLLLCPAELLPSGERGREAVPGEDLRHVVQRRRRRSPRASSDAIRCSSRSARTVTEFSCQWRVPGRPGPLVGQQPVVVLRERAARADLPDDGQGARPGTAAPARCRRLCRLPAGCTALEHGVLVGQPRSRLERALLLAGHDLERLAARRAGTSSCTGGTPRTKARASSSSAVISRPGLRRVSRLVITGAVSRGRRLSRRLRPGP